MVLGNERDAMCSTTGEYLVKQLHPELEYHGPLGTYMGYGFQRRRRTATGEDCQRADRVEGELCMGQVRGDRSSLNDLFRCSYQDMDEAAFSAAFTKAQARSLTFSCSARQDTFNVSVYL